MTDSGDIIYMSKLYFLDPTTPGYYPCYGPCMRQDWLDKLGLKVPSTIDEWYTVLKAFKEKDPNGNGKSDEIPYITYGGSGLQHLYGAWGLVYGLCQKDGKVVFGCIEPEFKDYLTTMNRWYTEGLIYADYLTGNRKKMEQLFSSDVAGAIYDWSTFLAVFVETAGPVIEGFNLMQVPWPKGPNGKCEYTVGLMVNNRVQGIGASISSVCKYPLEAFKMLDYLYSTDGRLLTEMGIEGVSYTMVNGEPKYTDAVLNDPTGLSPDAAASKYAIPHHNGFSTVTVTSWSQEAFLGKYGDMFRNCDIWGNGGKNMLLPMISLTSAESADASRILADINTYMVEHINKMIMGQEPLTNFDRFVTDIKNMGVDEVIKINQAAVDRFQKR
jgi:putative aldouronate transport system substrate-binding protein